ncbi:hypothetical protein [Siccirubricoccus sp. G192]|uniref:hypothetical protein n=1 Tax=Siccirubricoccus sp. G192 TaxID=2849651 RepID=UPI001C2BC80D|nr:hypothetical protein [Siccirubricoccus sp. G192]MBV1796583.1 hypothetical protein [Siccirubricoccus sp. G192]
MFASSCFLDDGGRPWAEPPHEAAVLHQLRRRLGETLQLEAAAAWEAEWQARTGIAATAIGAAVVLQGRLDAGEPVEAGATTSGGWRLVARLALEGSAAGLTTTLWALLPPDGTGLAFVATGGATPEPWSWEQVRAASDARRQAQAAAAAFLGAAEQADPVHRAERTASRRDFFRELAARRAAREAVERRGDALLHLFDGQPVRLEGAVLLGAGGAVVQSGIEARRLDIGRTGPFSGAPQERPWEEQVWARPLGDRVWRRGRVRPEPDRLVFVDAPAAEGPERGDGRPPGEVRPRTLEEDLLAGAEIRRKAAGSEVYARLLYTALENSTWRHTDGTIFEGGQRDTADLVASVVDAGSYLDWAWSGPTGLLDEEVLADLGALGWKPAR